MSCFQNQTREMPFTSFSNAPKSQVQPIMPIMPGMSGMPSAPVLPTGIPSGPPLGGATVGISPVPPVSEQAPQTLQSQYYTAGFLRNFIGRDVRVEFLIGSNGPLIDRIGTLLSVGASYIVIRPIRTDDTEICDLYSIKFVTIYA